MQRERNPGAAGVQIEKVYKYPVTRVPMDHWSSAFWIAGRARSELFNALLDEVFRKAVNARFVRIENEALIPFTKRMKIVPWNRGRGASSR
jgi:hypothetical protein